MTSFLRALWDALDVPSADPQFLLLQGKCPQLMNPSAESPRRGSSGTRLSVMQGSTKLPCFSGTLFHRPRVSTPLGGSNPAAKSSI